MMLMNPSATFPLAVRLRETGAPLGEVFQFMSGLYFRGKLAYASAFADAALPGAGVLVITPGLGLVEASRAITLDDLLAIARVGVSPSDPKFRQPLERDAVRLASSIAADDVAVLLGSIATDKYVDVLARALGGRLRFPEAFVGRGDMSRGGLLLRCVLDRQPLSYREVSGAVRHGPRPPRLTPLR
jgi:hypothetical protein